MSKRIILFFSILLSSSLGFGQNASIRFDGFYQSIVAEIDSIDNDTTWTYFRFYKDGTIISASTDGTADDIRKWFIRPGNKDNDYKRYTPIGIYKINGDKIEFTTTSAAATIVYKGTILNDGRLELFEKSLTADYEGREIYQFIKVKTRKR